MTDERRRHSRAAPGDTPRTSDKPGTPKARHSVAPKKRALYCEVDGLPVEIDPNELHSAGLFIVTPQPAPVDSEVEVFVRIGELRCEATGHVVKTVSCELAASSGKKPGYALLFTNLPEPERQRLADALRTLQTPAPERQESRASGEPPRRTPPAPRYDPKELALLEQLQKELQLIASKPVWSVLGVSQGAEAADVKAAFFEASKRYHPHLFARYAHPEIKRVVTELFIAHKRAYTSMLKLGKNSMRASRP